jgi:hypothetical protein
VLVGEIGFPGRPPKSLLKKTLVFLRRASGENQGPFFMPFS